MDGLRQIMFGVTGFARLRVESGRIVDRTDFVREPEETSDAAFLRLRRFGKPLLVSVLRSCYDVYR